VLNGEAVLTLGGPLLEFEHGLIDGVVIVGPHECMPCKIAEAQFGRASEDTGIMSLSVDVNGDPIDTDILDRFAYDIHHRRHEGPLVRPPVQLWKRASTSECTAETCAEHAHVPRSPSRRPPNPES
jgi:hypothetical protein